MKMLIEIRIDGSYEPEHYWLSRHYCEPTATAIINLVRTLPLQTQAIIGIEAKDYGWAIIAGSFIVGTVKLV